jgi:hypothetical protein
MGETCRTHGEIRNANKIVAGEQQDRKLRRAANKRGLDIKRNAVRV